MKVHRYLIEVPNEKSRELAKLLAELPWAKVVRSPYRVVREDKLVEWLKYWRARPAPWGTFLTAKELHDKYVRSLEPDEKVHTSPGMMARALESLGFWSFYTNYRIPGINPKTRLWLWDTSRLSELADAPLNRVVEIAKKERTCPK